MPLLLHNSNIPVVAALMAADVRKQVRTQTGFVGHSMHLAYPHTVIRMQAIICMPMQGVTYQLTQGVVKNIIPAIPSTNAIVAAACTLEALKMVSMCSTQMQNYMM